MCGWPGTPRNARRKTILPKAIWRCAASSPAAFSADPGRLQILQRNLDAVIDGRIRGVLYNGRDPRTVLRYPPVGIPHEVPGDLARFPAPQMHGGFDIALHAGYLEVRSWCRIVGAPGSPYVITADGATLVDSGFV